MTARIGRQEDIAEALIRILREDFEAAQQEFRARDAARPARAPRAPAAEARPHDPEDHRAGGSARRRSSCAPDADAGRRSCSPMPATPTSRRRAPGPSRRRPPASRGPGLRPRRRNARRKAAAEAHRQKTPVGEITMLFATAGAAVSTLTADFDGERMLSGRSADLRARPAGGSAGATQPRHQRPPHAGENG